MSKFSSNEHTLKDAIQRLLKTYELEQGLDEAGIVASWEEVVGAPIARKTNELFFRGRTLVIRLDSSALRHELSMQKEQLRTLLNEHAGKEVVKAIDIR
ncbi:MAG: DUF721 domain-containing protein [Cryomorphaceae bacterium]|nr:MAG: DUF721 domain-containing protein [Cryomorphaceae bacterium]